MPALMGGTVGCRSFVDEVGGICDEDGGCTEVGDCVVFDIGAG